MKINKSIKWWVTYLGMTLGAMLLCAAAIIIFNKPASKYADVQGTYVTLDKPITTESDRKLEVIEFFWYGWLCCINQAR